MRITDLNQQQVEMLDRMWQIDTEEEFNDWQQSLTQDEKNMSETLKELMIAELIDECSYDQDFYPVDAQRLLKNIFS